MVKYNELLLDTNFIIECRKRNLLESAKELVPGAEVITLRAVVDELEKMGEKLALEIVHSEGIRVVGKHGYADDGIVDYAKQGGVAVATNDKGLTKRLRGNGIAVVFPRGKGCGLAGGIA